MFYSHYGNDCLALRLKLYLFQNCWKCCYEQKLSGLWPSTAFNDTNATHPSTPILSLHSPSTCMHIRYQIWPELHNYVSCCCSVMIPWAPDRNAVSLFSQFQQQRTTPPLRPASAPKLLETNGGDCIKHIPCSTQADPHYTVKRICVSPGGWERCESAFFCLFVCFIKFKCNPLCSLWNSAQSGAAGEFIWGHHKLCGG